jgi:hypothetical protein
MASICLPLEGVAVRASHKVLMELDNNISLIVGYPQGVLGQQLRPHPIHLLNITIIILINYNKSYFIKFF